MVEGGGLCRARHVGRRHKTHDRGAEARDTKDERRKASDTSRKPDTSLPHLQHACLICSKPAACATRLPHLRQSPPQALLIAHASCRASGGLGALALLAAGCMDGGWMSNDARCMHAMILIACIQGACMPAAPMHTFHTHACIEEAEGVSAGTCACHQLHAQTSSLQPPRSSLLQQ